MVLLPLFFLVPPAYAHFEHFTHYNNRGGDVGPHYAYEALEPEYAGPNEPVAIMFSVQDHDGETYTISILWLRSILPQQANVLRLGLGHNRK